MIGRFVRSCDSAEFYRLVQKFPSTAFDALRKCKQGRRVIDRERHILSTIDSIQKKLFEIDGQGRLLDEKLAERFREKEDIIRQHMDKAVHEKNKALNDRGVPARLCDTTFFEVCNFTITE